MASNSNYKHHTDWNENVECRLKHIPSREIGEFIGRKIKSFLNIKVFNIDGLAACAQKDNGEFSFILNRRDANELRNNFETILTSEYTSVWLALFSNPMHSFIGRSLTEDDEENHSQQSSYSVFCRFGSLLSYDTFYSHISFQNTFRTLHITCVKKIPDSLNIELDEDRQLTISLKSIQKRKILVNIVKRDTEVLILLPLKYAPHITQISKKDTDDIYKNGSNLSRIRICYDNEKSSFINNIAKCSDLVLQFSPSNDICSFLAYLTAGWKPDQYEINFACFKARDWDNKWGDKRMPNQFNRPKPSFQDFYGLQMLRSLGHVYRDKWIKLHDGDLGWSSWNPDDRYALCCYAAERLCDDHGYDLRRTAQDYYARKKATKAENDDDQPMNIESTHRLQVAVCTLTPLRLIFQPLELTTGSRALRNERFGGSEHFLLVHFRDEDNRTQRGFNESIKQRLRKSMLDGIKSLDRQFKFIGTSTGQMKELAFWFIDLPPDIPDITAAHKLLGKFEGITNIATYVARVGQYFSTTWPIGIRLTKVERKEDMHPNSGIYYVMEIPDIKRGGYCFTDGVGLISWGLAGRVAQKMNIPLARKEDIPSAFQVRIAGCKGMVAIDPRSTFDEYYMLVRDSMIKFPSDNWDLEICEYARPMALSFNNQVIRLLSDLGNNDAVFLSLQSVGLRKNQIPEDQLPSIIDIALHKTMFYSASKENLLKNRIPVPVNDGRNLFGVADETGELKYGECFVQYALADSDTHGQRKFRVITGPVLVTKNPCMHPGDFRRLNAVRNNLLESSMRDVIVFPTTGSRPHSNEISGSDLDGDQYWVYWGTDLTIAHPEEPLSYKGADKEPAPVINQETIVNHIVDTFGAGGIIGIIANTHTVIADKSKQHSLDPDCKYLAEMFARAVDAPKTGEKIPIGPVRTLQKKWCRDSPQFMQKFSEQQYESTSISEKLFLIAKEVYFQGKETPMLLPLPQLPRKAKQASPLYIADKTFAKWLKLTNIQEDTSSDNSVKQPRTRKPREKQDDDAPPSSPMPLSPTPSEQATPTIEISQKQSTPIKKPTSRKKPPIVEDDDSVSTASASSLLTNSDSRLTTSLSVDSASLPESAQSVECTTELIVAIDGRMTTTTVLEFSPIDSDGPWTVDLKRAKTTPPEKEIIVNLVKSALLKHQVFKRTSSYNENVYGPLCLIVSYGQIRFNLPTTHPRSFGELKTLVSTQSNVIQFVLGKKELLNATTIASQTSDSGTSIYEFDCRLQGTSPSEYITFLFDSKKKLRQARSCHIWSKSYLREIDAVTDSLYELRSMITYKSGTPEFVRLVRSAFISSDSTDLLTGTKPNILLKHDLLQSNIVSLQLRIVEEKLVSNIGSSDSQEYYRQVKYASVSREPVKSKSFETVEFLALSITKNDEHLSRVCRYAVSPVENNQSVPPSSAASNASSSEQWMKIYH